MSGTVYSRFFWSDWLGDQDLRDCSALARSIWMDMLCLAATSVERGYPMIGEKPVTAQSLSRMSGETVEAVERCLVELEANRVFSRDRRGWIYSRRILRDDKRIAASAKGGKKGGVVTRSRGKGIFGTQGTTPDSESQVTESQVTESQVTTPPKSGHEVGEAEQKRRSARLSEALQLDPTNYLKFAAMVAQMCDLEGDGIDIDLDLIPCIEQMRSAGRDLSGKSATYFRKPALSFRNARIIAADVQRELAEAPIEQTDEAGWRTRLRTWVTLGYWPPKQGPAPRTGACVAPQELLDAALREWGRQGGHPREGFCLERDRYQPWADVRRLRREDWTDYGDPVADNVIPLRQVV